MSFTLPLLPGRPPLATYLVRLAWSVGLLILGGHAKVTKATDGLASADQTSAAAKGANDGEGVRAFHIHVSAEQLDELRKRIAATRWPDKETANDESQGIQLGATTAPPTARSAGRRLRVFLASSDFSNRVCGADLSLTAQS